MVTWEQAGIFMLLYFENLTIIINHSFQLTGWFLVKDKQRRERWSTEGMVMKINILSIEPLSRKCSGKKIWDSSKQEEQCQGAIYFPFCARVHAVLWLLHVELSFVRVLWGGGWFLCWFKKPNTCHMADVHCSRSKHPSPVFVPVLCPCASGTANSRGWRGLKALNSGWFDPGGWETEERPVWRVVLTSFVA